jgi:hypothetical protein
MRSSNFSEMTAICSSEANDPCISTTIHICKDANMHTYMQIHTRILSESIDLPCEEYGMSCALPFGFSKRSNSARVK